MVITPDRAENDGPRSLFWQDVRERWTSTRFWVLNDPLRAGVLAVCVLALAIGAGLVALNAASSKSVSTPASISLPKNSGEPTEASTQSQLVVQAAGAVNKPGVYRVDGQARVTDLIQAAGGVLDSANMDEINLAAPVSDGERVYVPKKGEDLPPLEGLPAPVGQKLNLNSATVEQLDGLPGVGPATAKLIVDYRRVHGPFHSIDDLGNVKGIGDAKLGALRNKLRL